MAYAERFSDNVTSFNSGSFVNPGIGRGMLCGASGAVTPNAADDTDALMRMLKIPSSAVLKKVILASGAQGGAAAIDVGFHYPSQVQGGIVINNGTSAVDFIADGLSLVGAVAPTDITNNDGAYSLLDQGKQLWEVLGFSSDPGHEFDLVITIKSALVNAVPLRLSAEFV
jgi:pimeloyl-ACP methyl ester carboxylesterase